MRDFRENFGQIHKQHVTSLPPSLLCPVQVQVGSGLWSGRAKLEVFASIQISWRKYSWVRANFKQQQPKVEGTHLNIDKLAYITYSIQHALQSVQWWGTLVNENKERACEADLRSGRAAYTAYSIHYCQCSGEWKERVYDYEADLRYWQSSTCWWFAIVYTESTTITKIVYTESTTTTKIMYIYWKQNNNKNGNLNQALFTGIGHHQD